MYNRSTTEVQVPSAVRGALSFKPICTVKVLPDVQSPVAVVIYTDTHTYKQKVLLYSKFMFNSQGTPRRAVAGRSCHIHGHTYLQTKSSPTQYSYV